MVARIIRNNRKPIKYFHENEEYLAYETADLKVSKQRPAVK